MHGPESAFQRLLRRAQDEPRHEPAMLRGLLHAGLYVNAPRSTDSRRLQLLSFRRPDSVRVIPVFSDKRKAYAAAAGAAQVIEVRGRALLEATRGATLMMDPKDVSMTLYPEEAAALLDEGRAALAPADMPLADLELLTPPADVRRLLHRFAEALRAIAEAERLDVAAARSVGGDGPDRVLALVCAPNHAHERIARTLALAVDSLSNEQQIPIDRALYAPGESLPDGLASSLDTAWNVKLRP